MAPKEIGQAVVATAGGFLVPGRSTGTITLFDASDLAEIKATQVSTDKKGWFYHKIVWYDVDGDGKLDILAARATAPSNPAGELIWLKQPSTNAAATTHWEERVIVQGPDVDFDVVDLDGDSKPEIVAAQFFSASQLAIYSCEEATWSLCNSSSVKISIVDNERGPFFTVKTGDFNNNGIVDLLVSNNQDGGKDGSGSVFVYEQNNSTKNWSRHELATGFLPYPSLIPSPGPHSRGAPGSSVAFHIETTKEGHAKPQILLSGDDGGFVALLRPLSEDSDDWNYSVEYVCNSTGTMGTPSVADLDGDGLTELIIPYYSEGKIEIFNFSAAAPPGVNPQCQSCLAKKDPAHLSPSSSWCFKDSSCHIVGSPKNPCSTSECASGASVSKCGCTSCNDPACWE